MNMRNLGVTMIFFGVSFFLSAQEIPNLQRPLFTKITATWCPNCGTWGWTYMKDIVNEHEESTLIFGAHHSGRLQSEAGSFLADNFKTFGQPVFLLGNDNLGVRSSNMDSKISEARDIITVEMNRDPDVNTGMYIQVSSDRIDVQTKTKFFNAMEGSYYVSIYLVENEVEEIQSQLSGEVLHPYVVRSAFSEFPQGVEIASGNIAKNAEFETSFSLIRQPEWNLDKSYLYAIVWSV